MRSQNHKNLIKSFTHHCKELLQATGFDDNKRLQDEAKPLIQFTLHLLRDIIMAVSGEQVTKTKIILYQSIQDMVHQTLSALNVYAHQPGI